MDNAIRGYADMQRKAYTIITVAVEALVLMNELSKVNVSYFVRVVRNTPKMLVYAK